MITILIVFISTKEAANANENEQLRIYTLLETPLSDTQQ